MSLYKPRSIVSTHGAGGVIDTHLLTLDCCKVVRGYVRHNQQVCTRSRPHNTHKFQGSGVSSEVHSSLPSVVTSKDVRDHPPSHAQLQLPYVGTAAATSVVLPASEACYRDNYCCTAAAAVVLTIWLYCNGQRLGPHHRQQHQHQQHQQLEQPRAAEASGGHCVFVL